jgi:hypothetical protein
MALRYTLRTFIICYFGFCPYQAKSWWFISVKLRQVAQRRWFIIVKLPQVAASCVSSVFLRMPFDKTGEDPAGTVSTLMVHHGANAMQCAPVVRWQVDGCPTLITTPSAELCISSQSNASDGIRDGASQSAVPCHPEHTHIASRTFPSRTLSSATEGERSSVTNHSNHTASDRPQQEKGSQVSTLESGLLVECIHGVCAGPVRVIASHLSDDRSPTSHGPLVVTALACIQCERAFLVGRSRSGRRVEAVMLGFG